MFVGMDLHKKYLVYPNGKVMVFVACSNDPFKLEDEADESILAKQYLDKLRKEEVGIDWLYTGY
jgi:hypothetical protein